MTNVLVVDSERSIRNTLKERLEYEGYRVETAETGGEAADKTEHSRFDVVLCDMAVPDIRVLQGITNDLINKSLVIFISFFWAKFGHFLVLSIKILFC